MTTADTRLSPTDMQCPAKYVCAFEKLHLAASDAPGDECLTTAGAAGMPAAPLLQSGSGFSAQPELSTLLLLMIVKEPQKPCCL